jgi:hypothetical protein
MDNSKNDLIVENKPKNDTNELNNKNLLDEIVNNSFKMKSLHNANIALHINNSLNMFWLNIKEIYT